MDALLPTRQLIIWNKIVHDVLHAVDKNNEEVLIHSFLQFYTI